MRLRRARPAIGGKTGDPQAIERQPGGFEQTDDLDGNGRRFRLEHRIVGEIAQCAERIEHPHPLVDDRHRGEIHQQLVEGLACLLLGARERTIAGPADGGEPSAPQIDPHPRRRFVRKPMGRERAPQPLAQCSINTIERVGCVAIAHFTPPQVEPRFLERRTTRPLRCRIGQIGGAQQNDCLCEGK